MINKKKEGGFYASKVRLFLNEYDGISLEEFCKVEKVSYSKMLNCPRPVKAVRLIENISISINARIGVSIGRCDVTTLSALIREMEVMR